MAVDQYHVPPWVQLMPHACNRLILQLKCWGMWCIHHCSPQRMMQPTYLGPCTLHWLHTAFMQFLLHHHLAPFTIMRVTRQYHSLQHVLKCQACVDIWFLQYSLVESPTPGTYVWTERAQS